MIQERYRLDLLTIDSGGIEGFKELVAEIMKQTAEAIQVCSACGGFTEVSRTRCQHCGVVIPKHAAQKDKQNTEEDQMVVKQPKATIPEAAVVSAAPAEVESTEQPEQRQEAPDQTRLESWEAETLILLKGIKEEIKATEQERTQLTERLETLSGYETAIEKTLEVGRQFISKGTVVHENGHFLQCEFCDHQWPPEFGKPIGCPNCHAPFLNVGIQNDLVGCKTVLNGLEKGGHLEPIVECVERYDRGRGSPTRHNRLALSCAFLVFHAMGMGTVTEFQRRLFESQEMRGLCHWGATLDVPSQPTLSRFFRILQSDLCIGKTLHLLNALRDNIAIYVKFHPKKGKEG